MKKVSEIRVLMNESLDINCHIEGDTKNLILSLCMLLEKAPMMKDILEAALEVSRNTEAERQRLYKQAKQN